MVRVDRLLTLHLFRTLMKLRRVDGGLRIPILMYHSISDDPEPGVHPYYKICTSPSRFREHMQFLKDNRYQVIPLSAALDLMSRARKPATRNLELATCNLEPVTCNLQPATRNLQIASNRYTVITFDDGYHDFYTNAWPVLSEFEYPATVFLTTAFIDDIGRSFKGRPCLTWNQIRELHERGVSFGSHTVNHLQLHDLKWSKIGLEIEDSKKAIEDKIGEPVKEFSYPYAYPEADRAFCKKLSHILKEKGYDFCVTTRIGRVLPGDDPLSLKRLPVNSSDDLGLLSAKLAGAYDWLAHVQRISKSIKFTLQSLLT